MHSYCSWNFLNKNMKLKEGFSIPVAGMIINRKVFCKYDSEVFRSILNELESII